MRQSRFSDEPVLAIVRQGGSGRKAACLVQAYGITEHTCYRRTSRYSGLELGGLWRLHRLEDENRRPKHIVAELTLDSGALKAVASRRR